MKTKMINSKGITLIALVITIIVLLILAAVSVAMLTGENGLLNKSTEAKEAMQQATAREKLELVFEELAIDKRTKAEYNENEYIDNVINGKEGMTVILGDIVLVDGYKFEIDRSVPKIGASLGLGEESQEIELSANISYSADYTKATIIAVIKYEGEITEIKVNGEAVEIPEKTEEGKYIVAKDITSNGTYNIYVKNRQDEYKTTKISSTEISENLTIKNAEELVAFRNRVNKGATYDGKTITVIDNIDLSKECYKVDGTVKNDKSWEPIATNATFKGTFDGSNNTISNLYINSNLIQIGLFSTSAGTIKNIVLDNANVSGSAQTANAHIGGIAGVNDQTGIIENCIVKENCKVSIANSYANYAGGITGVNFGRIKGCINKGTVYGEEMGNISNMVGGIAGACNNQRNTVDVNISECYNIGSVSGMSNSTKINNAIHVGGITGQSYYNVVIDRCYNEGIISAKGKASHPSVGGIVGLHQYASTISNCYNTGSISFDGTGNITSRVGGIVGSADNDNSLVENTYNIGKLSSVSNGTKFMGGCAGTVQMNAKINNCYSASDIGTSGIYGYFNNATATNSSMQAREKIKTLAGTLGSAFRSNTNNINGGFPILSWQVEE